MTGNISLRGKYSLDRHSNSRTLFIQRTATKYREIRVRKYYPNGKKVCRWNFIEKMNNWKKKLKFYSE